MAAALMKVVRTGLVAAMVLISASALAQQDAESTIARLDAEAEAYFEADDPQAAYDIYRAGLDALEAQAEGDGLEAAALHHRLGKLLITYDHRIRARESGADSHIARAHLTSALGARISQLGPTHPEVADSYQALGQWFSSVYDFSSAATALEQALSIREAALGDHVLTAQTLNRLAMIYQQENRLQDAAASFERAAMVFAEAVGPESIEVGASLALGSFVLSNLERFDEAEPKLVEAVRILEQNQGQDSLADLLLSQALEQLADIYEASGRTDEAAQLRGKAGGPD